MIFKKLSIASFSIIIVFSVYFSTIYAQEENFVPSWIKNNAKWWADGLLTDDEFIQGISWLIEKKLIVISSLEQKFEEPSDTIPSWIKIVASSWANDQITDIEFLNAIKFLIEIGVIDVPIETNVSIISENSNQKQTKKESDPRYELLGDSPLFRMFAFKEDIVMTLSGPVVLERQYEFKPEVSRETYQEIVVDYIEQRALVVIPTFTSSAYAEPNGFYAYYRGECDTCITIKIDHEKPLSYTASGNAVAVFKLLGYQFITDITIDKNPEILKEYDKIILLHNEYVTSKMFDAITSHPKVLYLFPNALYAEVELDYNKQLISLIRGHDYPPEDPVKNGFDWEYEEMNHPWEYDNECINWKFFEIKNGMMLNCYPELIIHKDVELQKMIKDY